MILTIFALTFVHAGGNLPEGAGKELIFKNCQACHELDRILKKRRSPNEWKMLVQKMIEEGLEISDKDKKTVIDYLVTHLGTSP